MDPDSAYREAVAEHDYQRRMAFKRIIDEYNQPRRRRKEMLKWWKEHPSPLRATEQLENLRRVLFDEEH